MNICGYYPESINEGDDLRAVIFLSGCRHRCSGCFNPATWNFNYGEPFTEQRQQEIITEMANNQLLGGMTLAGGDPFFSADEAADFIDNVRAAIPNFSVWIYTGYIYEDLIVSVDSAEYRLLMKCQVVIDGPFIESLKNTSLPYRGSSNQRIIDIQSSIRYNDAVELTT
ncbi:anaerobic ribonucleoside-triphosphate reductase activating protein [Paenibacillus crassostreae]|uniref:Anaerobic ribonucleoside-triphosphate reductase-activating protein n=1 Tax=Paenibacillus crassostreae TaxID=1763538 RepID=A0A167BTG7_9BACL|nr:anaerobic ribonucleoside-triphosphate reductase activating protein [Paenibacillus crassostreae]AOZ92477.1 anaerobic ribonucleoside-triphosphate reductase activating protein [Paenibacillus crassostreae]OAB72425.1 ribonucleoside-triphosphate reductase activating protein [Paenibacillus crassostreae]